MLKANGPRSLPLAPHAQAVTVPFVSSELARLEEVSLFASFNICVGVLIIFAARAPPAASVVLQIGLLVINSSVFVYFAGTLLYERQRLAAVRALRNPNGDGTVRWALSEDRLLSRCHRRFLSGCLQLFD